MTKFGKYLYDRMGRYPSSETYDHQIDLSSGKFGNCSQSIFTSRIICHRRGNDKFKSAAAQKVDGLLRFSSYDFLRRVNFTETQESSLRFSHLTPHGTATSLYSANNFGLSPYAGF